MTIAYPKSPEARHLRKHTEALLFWSAGVLALVAAVSFVCVIQNQQHSAPIPLALTPMMPVPLIAPHGVASRSVDYEVGANRRH